MPVAITLATIAVLRGGNRRLPFFDPDLLHELLGDALAEEWPATLDEAQPIVDRIERLLTDYRAAVQTGLEVLDDELADPDTNAAAISVRARPLDRNRDETIRAVIKQRQALLELLDDEQWAAVFD